MPIQAKQAHTLFLAQETDTDQAYFWDSATQRIVTNILPLVMLILIGSCTRNMKLLGYTFAALQLIASIPRAYRRIRKLPLDWAVVAAAVYIFTIGLASGAYYYGVAIFTYPYIASLLYIAMSAIDTVIDAMCMGSVDIADALPVFVPVLLYFSFWQITIAIGYDYYYEYYWDRFAPFAAIGTLLELLAVFNKWRRTDPYEDVEAQGAAVKRMRMQRLFFTGTVVFIITFILVYYYRVNKEAFDNKISLENGSVMLTKHPFAPIALGSDDKTYDLDTSNRIWIPRGSSSSLFSF